MFRTLSLISVAAAVAVAVSGEVQKTASAQIQLPRLTNLNPDTEAAAAKSARKSASQFKPMTFPVVSSEGAKIGTIKVTQAKSNCLPGSSGGGGGLCFDAIETVAGASQPLAFHAFCNGEFAYRERTLSSKPAVVPQADGIQVTAPKAIDRHVSLVNEVCAALE